MHTIQTLRPLADLGERPLGDYIFQQPGLQRGVIETAQLSLPLSAWQLTSAQSALPTPCHARRSVFTLQSLPLLVAEAFLPGLMQLDSLTS